MNFYRRHLPHLQLPFADYFLTFRLAGSLPTPVARRSIIELQGRTDVRLSMDPTHARQPPIPSYRLHRIREFQQIVHPGAPGPRWLAKPEVAGIVKEGLPYRDVRHLTLYAFCIMPTHIHIACHAGVRDSSPMPIIDVLANFKWYTALKCNKVLHRSGAFWLQECYDHVIRSGPELERTIRYIVNNPVKAGLARRWQDWRWTYCRADMVPVGGR
jgi:putative transposase